MELEQARKIAERELAAVRGHEEYVRGLERDRDSLLDYLVEVAPEAFDSLTPEQRHQFYKILRLTDFVQPDGVLEVSWAGDQEGTAVCETATFSR